MLGPSLAVLVLFFLAPVLMAAAQSLYSWDLLTPPVFVGAANYRALIASGDALRITVTTLRFSAIVVSVSMAAGLGLALALNRPGRFFAFVRSAIFSAYVVSWVAVALLWTWILDPDAGLGAAIARGLGAGRVAFLGDPKTALTTLALVTVWKITGYSMIVFLVGLQDVPAQLLEAASLDGANALARFRHVVWPLLRPTAAFVATTSLIVSFQAFDVVRVMTQGGPAGATTLFVYAIYEQVFLDLRVGRASALTVLFFAILLGLAGLQLWAFRARGAKA
jgi:sn-glycerol 3-phosphate transport system permease protein